MNPRPAICVFATLLLFSVAVTHAQDQSTITQPKPFGFEMGMTKEQVLKLVGQKALEEDKNNILVFSTAPTPHPDFDMYSVFISPDKGLLKVVAFTKTISVNDEGNELQDEFNDIYAGLAAKYGQGQKFDFVQGDNDVNNESQFWMMTLLQGERKLAVLWAKSGDRDTEIGLEAQADSIHTGHLSLSYEFPGWENYLESLKSKNDSVF